MVARITLAAALTIALALAWSSVWRPVVMMRQVGLGGWSAESGRRCDDPPSMKWRHCYRPTALTADTSRIEERVSLDRRTRRITHLERLWRVTDSAGWSWQQDSIARDLVRRGGEQIQCPLPSDGTSGVRSISTWRFQEQDVRMIASRRIDTEHLRPEWLIQVTGVPVGHSGCQAWTRTRRLLTPMEMVAELHHWLAERSE